MKRKIGLMACLLCLAAGEPEKKMEVDEIAFKLGFVMGALEQLQGSITKP
jgi:hypothetical protein